MHFPRFFVFLLICSLGLPVPATADAIYDSSSTSDPGTELIGTWKLESFANGPDVIEEFELFKDGAVLAKDQRWHKMGLPPGTTVSGTWKIDNNRLIAVLGGQGLTMDYTLSGAALTLVYDKTTNYHAVYLRPTEWEQARAEEKRNAEEALKAAGFIALSESPMNWNDAKAWCRQQGGRLPRINNSDAWDGRNPPYANISIDSFGERGAPWPAALPYGPYWTGTETGKPGDSWLVPVLSANILTPDNQSRGNRVVCVP